MILKIIEMEIEFYQNINFTLPLRMDFYFIFTANNPCSMKF